MSLTGGELQALACSPSRLRELKDEELMSALCDGLHDALAILFERHSALVFRVARAILRDDGEAEETVQRVFLDIYQARSQYSSDRGAFLSWLRQYAYHRSLDRRSHLHRNHFYKQDDINDLTIAEFFHGAGNLLSSTPQELAYLVEQMLATLESRQRKVIEMTYFEGLTAIEIAEKTGESASAVRNHLYRGLAKLRNSLLETKKASTAAARDHLKGMLVEFPRPL
jgi:RNA polymerase sigma-70 factor (ECF subfamily)